MKNQQKQQARALYLQTGMTKTEIAARVGVDRRTIRLWAKDGDWDKIRSLASRLEEVLSDSCYHLVNQFADNITAHRQHNSSVMRTDIESLHKVLLAVTKLKSAATN